MDTKRMSKRLIIEPDGWPCMLGEVRPGFFTYKDELCFKSEYYQDGHSMEVFLSNGESFWAGAKDEEERRMIVVQPVKYKWETEL
jgi:hypothetical protein